MMLHTVNGEEFWIPDENLCLFLAAGEHTKVFYNQRVIWVKENLKEIMDLSFEGLI